jgi:hypothetical protein
MVRSCFVVTAFVEEAINLKQWQRDRGNPGPSSNALARVIFWQLGHALRRLHEARFFLFTPKASNIIMRKRLKQHPEFLFLDLPYAKTIRWRPLARWAQGRDLGTFLGSFVHREHDEERALFYEAYFPDPLGRSPDALRRRVERATRVAQNRTPVAALVHRTKRYLRRAFRDLTRTPTDGR